MPDATPAKAPRITWPNSIMHGCNLNELVGLHCHAARAMPCTWRASTSTHATRLWPNLTTQTQMPLYLAQTHESHAMQAFSTSLLEATCNGLPLHAKTLT